MAARLWENRSLYFGISLLFHVLLLFYLKTSRATLTAPTIAFREVSYLEETPQERYRNPKVQKLLSSATSPPGPSKTEPEKKLSETPLKPSTPEPKLELAAPKLDLSPSMKPSLEPSAPKIDLASGLQSNVDLGVRVKGEGLELSTGLAGADVVIASGGAGTKEILSRPEVKPSIDLSSSGRLGTGGSLPGSGGGRGGAPGISLEPVGPGPEIRIPSPSAPPPPPSNILENPSTGSRKPTMEVTGQIANREILRRVRPQYPPQALREGREGVVQVKFFVSPEGRVLPNIVVVRSSGWADLDQAVIQALREWQFAPISGREDQWGILTVVFRLL